MSVLYTAIIPLMQMLGRAGLAHSAIVMFLSSRIIIILLLTLMHNLCDDSLLDTLNLLTLLELILILLTKLDMCSVMSASESLTESCAVRS